MTTLRRILLNWSNSHEQLTENWLQMAWWGRMDEATRREWEIFFEERPQERAEMKWHAAKDTVYRLAVEQAKRLGYEPHSEISFNHNPIVLVEMVKGYGAGQELIKKWDFHPGCQEPGSMWDIMDCRRDGDAVIGLIGDDRGWKDDWTYYVAIGWSPEELKDRYDDQFCLI